MLVRDPSLVQSLVIPGPPENLCLLRHQNLGIYPVLRLFYHSSLLSLVFEYTVTEQKRDPEDILAALKEGVQSAVLSTLGEDGEPHSGYTPFIFDDAQDSDHHIIIFVSQLALHTRDLLANKKVSVMLIADESASDQIFARTRVSYQCAAEVIHKDTQRYDELLDSMQVTHGKMIGLLRTLPDFVLFRLKPFHGQFVMGFGQAFALTGEKLNQFEHSRRA